jgi:hypothetical protein
LSSHLDIHRRRRISRRKCGVSIGSQLGCEEVNTIGCPLGRKLDSVDGCPLGEAMGALVVPNGNEAADGERLGVRLGDTDGELLVGRDDVVSLVVNEETKGVCLFQAYLATRMGLSSWFVIAYCEHSLSNQVDGYLLR